MARKADKQKANTRTNKVMLANEKDMQSFGDEQQAVGVNQALSVKFTQPGESFQGILLGRFISPAVTDDNGKQTRAESIGYNFLTLDGARATVWGGVVLNDLMPDFEPPCFVTITFTGMSKRTKKFKAVSSEAGFKQYKHLLKGVDLSTYEWFEEIPI